MIYAANNFGQSSFVIHGTDTDISVMCIYLLAVNNNINEVWIYKSDAYLPEHKLLESLALKFGKDAWKRILATTILCVYVITGCDSVSYHYRRGKKRAAKLALEINFPIENLLQFGTESLVLNASPVVVDDVRKIFAALYGPTGFQCLNSLCQHIFASSGTDLRALPPSEDAFHFHDLRALYQFALFKRAHLSSLSLPSPVEYGRCIINNRLVPIMMKKPPKPPSAKIIFCKCKSSNCLRNCACKRAGIPCFIGCTCLGQRVKYLRLDVTFKDEEDSELKGW